jgi:transcription elongation GreA/GreB family factor
MANDMSDSTTGEVAQGEEWFLAQVERPSIDTASLLQALEVLRVRGQGEAAESRAELLQDMLVERKQTDAALEVLQRRAQWAAAARRTDGEWLQEALDVCGSLWDQKALVEESGFDKNVPPPEAIRRLRLLRALREGVLCHDRTWGLGVVTRVDHFYKRVEVDFERRLGHQLSLGYAAETLELVGDDHLMVWKKRRPDELKALVQNDPAEVVRMVLRSFGPTSVSQLQALLAQGVVPEADWKRFWDAARKGLKKDPHVVVPSGRTEPLRLIDTSGSRESEWFDNLGRERDLPKLINLLEELAGRSQLKLNELQAATVRDRVAFTAKGAWSDDHGTVARVIMAAAALGVADAVPPERSEVFFRPSIFMETMRQLPSRQSRSFLRFLGARDAERTRKLQLDLLARMEIGVLNEALSYLLETGAEAEVAQLFKQAYDSRAPTLEMLSWLSRFMEKREAWNLGHAGLTASFMLDVLEQEASGERLKAQNQLREKFAKPEWLKDLMGRMERKDTEQMLMRIKDSPAWPTLDRQSILAHMVKLDGTLAPLLASKINKSEAVRGPVTSERSFRERQIQLDKIINIEIPKVAKDIAIARSYGDLRENFEFKAAKEAQSILFHRRDELMKQLRQVTPTDFKDFTADKAGIATTLTVEYADGRREQYHVLGEWDSDTSLGIISSTSRMAQALAGHVPGDEIVVPADHGEERCRLVDVKALPDEIRDWIAGRR